MHAASGRAPGSACWHLEGASSWEPGWLLSTPAYPEGRSGNGSPHLEHLQLELWCRVPVVEGGLVLVLPGLGRVKLAESLPARPRTVTTVERSGRQMDRWGQHCGSVLWHSASRCLCLLLLKHVFLSHPCLALLARRCLGKGLHMFPVPPAPTPGSNVPAVKH